MEDNDFVSIASLICEPKRAKILWKLLDGRAYTASELASFTATSPTSLSNHLSKLLKGNIVKAWSQGRHRYYTFANDHVAHAVEALANLAPDNELVSDSNLTAENTLRYCRSCYDHIAGHVGVHITEAMVVKGYLKCLEEVYLITHSGWGWLSQIGITKDNFQKSRRPLTRQCLDWSERRPHLAGHLGAIFLRKGLELNWFRKVEFSRKLIVTSIGKRALYDYLAINL